jgi:hypothetical protein
MNLYWVAQADAIRKRHWDLTTATLHGPPPGDWWTRWVEDVGVLLVLLDAEQARSASVRLRLEELAAALRGP